MTSLSEQADHFSVWRMAHDGADHTYGEVAKATGVPLRKVKRLCVANGWRFVDDDPVEELDFSRISKNGVDVKINHV